MTTESEYVDIKTDFKHTNNTRWWQGPCFCDFCENEWQAVVEIPIEATRPPMTLECPRCHKMRGGPA
jgi:hypothetical protein